MKRKTTWFYWSNDIFNWKKLLLIRGKCAAMAWYCIALHFIAWDRTNERLNACASIESKLEESNDAQRCTSLTQNAINSRHNVSILILFSRKLESDKQKKKPNDYLSNEWCICLKFQQASIHPFTLFRFQIFHQSIYTFNRIRRSILNINIK